MEGSYRGTKTTPTAVQWHKLQCSRSLLLTTSQQKDSNYAVLSLEQGNGNIPQKSLWNVSFSSFYFMLPSVKWWRQTGRSSRWRRGSLSSGGCRTLLCVTVGEPAPVSTVTPTQPARLTNNLLIHLHHGKYTWITTDRQNKHDDDKHAAPNCRHLLSQLVTITIALQSISVFRHPPCKHSVTVCCALLVCLWSHWWTVYTPTVILPEQKWQLFLLIRTWLSP